MKKILMDALNNGQVKEIIESGEFDSYGFRIQEIDTTEIGNEINYVSKVWVEGEETDEELNGVCAISAKVVKSLSNQSGDYFGNYIYLLGSNSTESGEDFGEIIMQNAVVLAKLTR